MKIPREPKGEKERLRYETQGDGGRERGSALRGVKEGRETEGGGGRRGGTRALRYGKLRVK